MKPLVVLAVFAGLILPTMSRGASTVIQDAVQAESADQGLEPAERLLAEARALRAEGDARSARSRLSAAIEILLREGPAASEKERIDLLNGAALQARDLGDLPTAAAAYHHVLDALLRTLPAEHNDVQNVRGNLAITLSLQGDLKGARKLFEQIFAVWSRALPDDHRSLQTLRLSLAVTLKGMGELEAARRLEEKVLEIRRRTLSADDPALLRIRLNLGATIYAQGDHEGARGILEEVLALQSQVLRDEDPELQATRLSLAAVLYQLGELEAALELENAVLEVHERIFPNDHPDLAMSRLGVAATLKTRGDLEAARELEERVLEVRLRALPEGHPDRSIALVCLGNTCYLQGDLETARKMFEQAVEIQDRSLPDEHVELKNSRANLAVTIAGLQATGSGDLGDNRARFVQVTGSLIRGLQRAARAALWGASARESEERCGGLLQDVGRAMSYAEGLGVFPADAELERQAFVLSETLRGASLMSARLIRRALRDEVFSEIRDQLEGVSTELTRIARAGSGSDAFQAAVARRDELEQALVRQVAGTDGPAGELELDPDRLAALLAPSGAVIAYRRYVRSLILDGAAFPVNVESLCAFVIRPGSGVGSLQRIELGPIAPIREAAAAWRALISPEDSSVRSGSGLRGLVVAGPLPPRSVERDAAAGLARMIFEPLLPAVGDAERLVVVVDGFLNLVPLDALPLTGGAGEAADAPLIGDRHAIEQRRALFELLVQEEPGVAGRRPPTLLAVGGANFNAMPPGPDAGPVAALDTLDPGKEVARLLRGGLWEEGFSSLQQTGIEARGVADLLGAARVRDAKSVVLEGLKASRESIERWAPQARWLHIATHGWFARDSIRSWEDPTPLDAHAGIGVRSSTEQRVIGSSPMILCGLALAGANLPADELGRYPGLVTAQEISTWDLSNCELAVLSACDTNVGIRRAGQGVASLQKALHMAGARSVITSLWKVPDEATKELMLDFYRRLWVEEKPKRQALWEAKMKIKNAKDEDGQPRYQTRDWAAWVLTGDPD